MTEQITLEELNKVTKLIHECSPCYCKDKEYTYCPRHGILRISKHDRDMIKEVFGI